MYIHQQDQWPDFRWDQGKLAVLLAEVRHQQGRLLGRMEALGFALQKEASLQTLTQDVLKSSEIEGETFDREQVRSSVARRMGIDIGGPASVDRHVEGSVEVLLDATGNHETPLTKERLCAWHAALFPTGRSGMQRITVGNWRNASSGAMQIVSGPFGREKVHYEAPTFDRLDTETKAFIRWFNAPLASDPVIKAALAHFWFVTIHPFDDGNGRIARAIADMMLARSERTPWRFYSMSTQIQRERKVYYEVLEQCQKGGLNISLWIEWFLSCLKRAIEAAAETLQTIFSKARFWESHSGETFNDRQRTLINRLLDGLEGKLTSSKWAKLGKCSQDTALRDIKDLLGRQILSKEQGGGRSTSYVLCSLSLSVSGRD